MKKHKGTLCMPHESTSKSAIWFPIESGEWYNAEETRLLAKRCLFHLEAFHAYYKTLNETTFLGSLEQLIKELEKIS
jgi:hypothetical protein